MRLAVIFAVVAMPAFCLAANADHPYANVDPSNDAGNDTGDASVEALNQAQLDGYGWVSREDDLRKSRAEARAASEAARERQYAAPSPQYYAPGYPYAGQGPNGYPNPYGAAYGYAPSPAAPPPGYYAPY